MGSRKSSTSCFLLVIAVFSCITWPFFLHGSVQAVTDPIEAKALNTIFARWGINSSNSSITWNNTGNGDLCTGNANRPEKESLNYRDDNVGFNPAILCECDADNNCHIVRLKAYNLQIAGPIPEELKELRFLNNLEIGKNFFSGPIPAFIGSFPDMEYLSLGLNSLSGPLPKEIGNLTKLISLGLGSRNNFSGPIPPELGNLTNLQQMYIDSNGLEGEIPETLGNLKKLKILFASDNDFTGKVPNFLGNLTNLISLRLQGNSFQGPIPQSFSNLVNLKDLRLGEISNTSSTLGFIRNMSSLEHLTLRNCMISDVIPSYIGQYVNLADLDLSFNNITGQIPQPLFNLPLISTLYLGNNSISGSLPEQKVTTLTTIDLSYNELSGSFPQWVGDKKIQLNLVANNFVIDRSNSFLPWGSGCLQRDVPCGRGSPTYYSFAVNCGGDETVTVDGTEYENDNQNLTTASYYVSSCERWGVSSIGTFNGDTSPSYVESTTSNIKNTSDLKIFQSARLSPSSLRYYGFGLENGEYNVTLLFAEILFPDDLTWHSFGRRVFDIYIQGNLVVKDFDIRAKASRTSFTAIKEEYRASVTKNFLEIHLFWAGKGTCCIPSDGHYGSLISAISVTPNFIPTVSNKPPTFCSKKENNTALIAGITAGAAVLLCILTCGTCFWIWKRNINGVDEDLIGLPVLPNTFSYLELKNATQNFNSSNKLGEGGFGAVYKGKLSDGTVVAVKQLSVESLQGKRQFVSEVAAISAVKHRNLVQLHGCCYEGDKRLLLYEYLENRSLDQALFGKSGLHLDWPTRFMICLGTARGLAYLHEESRVRIIHRDIKAGNILLDADLSPKISDFGLAKLYDERMTHISTKVAGTFGYLAPEYAMRGHLTEKADVYAFGVVVFELLCGRPNTSHVDVDRTYLIEWAWELHEEKRDMEMLDQTLPSFNIEEVHRMIGVAFLCTQLNPLLRPPMSRIVAMLVGDTELGDIPSKPTYLSEWHFDESGVTDKSTITSTSSNVTYIQQFPSVVEEEEGR